MKIQWRRRAREDYKRWRQTDPKVWKLINAMITQTQLNPYEGIGRPRELQLDWKGWWVREITAKDRLIYRIKNGFLEIARCRGHYE
jgi:toxin YoeB